MESYRFFSFTFFVGLFFATFGFAMGEQDKENQLCESSLNLKKKSISSRRLYPIEVPHTAPSSEKKRKREDSQENLKLLNRKRQKKNNSDEELIPTFLSLQKNSPRTAERDYFDQIRKKLILEEFPTLGNKKEIPSPKVRIIYKKNDSGNYFTNRVKFKKMYIFQADFLFDTYAKVMNESGKWETNLSRMQRGCSPIGHRGIVNRKERIALRKKEIHKRQRAYRIDIQHITQKDTGLTEDPLCEMTHSGHMGLNARFIIGMNPKTEKVEIAYSGLEKEEAKKLCKPGQEIKTNVLHFRKGSSLISRDSFDKWRTGYWKYRAKEIKKGNFQSKPSHYTVRRKLFSFLQPMNATNSLLLKLGRSQIGPCC